MVILKTYGALFFFLIGISACRSAPPSDLTDSPEGPTAGRQRVNENDLVYTDNTKPLPDPEKDFATMKTDVVGRSAPGREGRALVKLRRGEPVNVLKPSNDGRWLAVVTLKSRRKAWVPANTVKQPPPAPAPGPGGMPGGAVPGVPAGY